MSPKELKGKRIAILVADGFEQEEMTKPRTALEALGAETFLIALEPGSVRSMEHKEWGKEFPVDIVLSEAHADTFHALLIPGGVISPDTLRTEEAATRFVQAFVDDGRPIAAICHGPWLLVETTGIADHKVTSYRSLRTDLENAGARWVDQEVVVDEGIVTSRGPQDMDAFIEKMVEEIREGRHTGRREGWQEHRRGIPASPH